MVQQQLELSLPFENFIGRIGSQKFAKDNYNRGADIMVFKIPFKDILIWEGYNARTFYENIPELAEGLLKHGQKTPFQLILVKDGNRAFLKKGGRRYKAYELLIQQGRFNPDSDVPFELTNTTETIEEMILDLFTSNNFQEPLKPIDQSTVAWRLKHLCGNEKSNEEVAEIMKLSRQVIDNYITIFSAPDDLKNQIRTGAITFTDGLSILKNQKKLKKQADKKEEEASQSSMYVQPEPKDNLKDEVQEGKDADLQAEIFREKEAAREKRETERLEREANLFTVTPEILASQIGKHLAADAWRKWIDTTTDEVTGEVKEVPTKEFVMKQGHLIDENAIQELVNFKVEEVYIYKENKAAESVITEPPAAEPEKSKYDSDRPEISQIQNIIKLGDRLSVRVEKLEISEGDKKDLTDWVKWLQKDALELREWVHSNKKQNKRDR